MEKAENGKKKPQKVPRSQAMAAIVELRPVLLKSSDAAEYRGVSHSKIRQERQDDVKAIREGKEPKGPRFFSIGSSIYYRLDDLDAWIAANAVERGVVAFSNRVRPGKP